MENIENNKDNEVELENQLHQQFAENDNKRNSVFTSFIVGIIALFGFYGFVFVNTKNNGFSRECWNFTLPEYLLMSFVTIGILFFLAIMALNIGYSLRRDQFIVFNIRKKRFTEKGMKEIFGKLYSPFGKCYCNFIPDFYNLFFRLFFISEIFLFITAIIKINDFVNTVNSFFNFNDMFFIIFIMSSHVIFIFLSPLLKKCYYKKYKCSECAFAPDTQKS